MVELDLSDKDDYTYINEDIQHLRSNLRILKDSDGIYHVAEVKILT